MTATTTAAFALAALLATGDQESFLGARTALALFADELEEDADLAAGLSIVAVVENSPAEAAGLAAGDDILRIDGEPLRSPGHLEALVAARAPGSELAIEARRGSRIFAVAARTVPRLVPRTLPPPRYVLEERRLRLALADVGADEARRLGLTPGAGVRVERVLEGSTAAKRLRVGDVLVRLGESEIHGTEDFLALTARLEPGERIDLGLRRGGEDLRVRVRVLTPDRYLSKFHVPLIVRYASDTRADETSFSMLFWIFQYHRKETRSSWRFLWLFHLEFGTNEEIEEIGS